MSDEKHSRFELDELFERLKRAQRDFELELEHFTREKRKQFRYSLERGKIAFERNTKIEHLRKRIHKNTWAQLRQTPLSFILSAPLIYGMILPLAFLDISLSLYQHVCFRVYNIPRVRRKDYFAILDRTHLGYLNNLQKFNCLYCGYGNGLMSYAREITARTEQYWCPIKHARKHRDPHQRQHHFFEYGDADSWKNELEKVRLLWAETQTDPAVDKPTPTDP